MRIGYELELLSQLNDDEIENDLKRLFRSKAKLFEVTTDCTIKRDKNTKAIDGWNGWEIITPPTEIEESLNVLEILQSYLQDTNTITNSSCGFHVSISTDDMTKFSPITLIALIDEYKLAKMFSRENNPYCVPWFYYFDQIWKRIKRDQNIFDKFDHFIYNSCILIDSTSKGEFVDAYCEEAKYAARVSKFFDEKYLTVNINKLNNKDPYVEFRMMGGKDYHLKMLSPLVKELGDCMTQANNGLDKELVTKYFEQYL